MPATASAPGGTAGGPAARLQRKARIIVTRLLSAFLAAAVLLALIACGGTASNPTVTPQATRSPAAPSPSAAAPSSLGATQFDVDRVLAHIEALAVSIGVRAAGTENELRAAQYIRDQLASYGYSAEIQPFPFDVFTDAGSTAEIVSPPGGAVDVYAMNPSIDGSVEAPLVVAGRGRPEEFPADTAGKIALIERGDITFGDKVENAAAAGAAAALVYNTSPGPFLGNLGGPSAIPAASMAGADGQELLSLLAAGPVTLRLNVRTQSGPRESRNVVARPPNGQCRAVVGGHYDSVPAGPGANDNASGTATSIEIARVLAADGQFDDVCFVLFGAEEVGLLGSAAYVESLPAAEKQAMEGMVNLDMIAVGSQWFVAGSFALRDLAAEEAGRLGFSHTEPLDPESGLGSDHASFIAAGIPAVFLHRMSRQPADDPNYHTAGDVFSGVERTSLSEAGPLALAILQALLSGA